MRSDGRFRVSAPLGHHHRRRLRQLVHGQLDLAPLARRHLHHRVGRLEAGALQVDLVHARRHRDGERRRTARQPVDAHRSLVGGLAADQVGAHVQESTAPRARAACRRSAVGVRQRAHAQLAAAEIDLALHPLGEAALRLEREIFFVHRQRVVAAVERAVGQTQVAVRARQLGIGGDGGLERLDRAFVVAARVALVALGELAARFGRFAGRRLFLVFFVAVRCRGERTSGGGDERDYEQPIVAARATPPSKPNSNTDYSSGLSSQMLPVWFLVVLPV